MFAAELFRVYTNHDVIGCEIAGALKNVIAIASGMADGLGTGDNTAPTVITRGLAELTRLGVAMGGRPRHLLRPRRHGRPGRHVHQHAEPQPLRRRAARQRAGGIDEIIAEMSRWPRA